MPKSKKTRVLAIDPGTREMGVAVLDNRSLVCHGVQTIRARTSPYAILRRGQKLVSRLIKDFRPDVLAIEKTFFANNRNAALLNVFADEIAALGRQQRLRVLSFAPSTVKKAVFGNGRATKMEIAHAVVARYPELRAHLSQDRKWKERYYANMFDAVAVGLMATGESRRALWTFRP